MLLQFSDLLIYLKELNTWCDEEQLNFSKNIEDRNNTRQAFYAQSQDDQNKFFVNQFDKTIVDIIRPILLSIEKNPLDILPLLLVLHKNYPINPPLQADSTIKIPDINAEEAIQIIQVSVKENFELIGNSLLSSGLQSNVFSLSDAIALHEKKTQV